MWEYGEEDKAEDRDVEDSEYMQDGEGGDDGQEMENEMSLF